MRTVFKLAAAFTAGFVAGAAGFTVYALWGLIDGLSD